MTLVPLLLHDPRTIIIARPAVMHESVSLKMQCLSYIVLESKKIAIIRDCSEDSIVPLFTLFFYSKCQLILGFINVIAPNNDILMDELNVIYFAPKWWLNITIWLPRTTDNSTYFAQSLEIRGVESRLCMKWALTREILSSGWGGGVRTTKA